MFKKISAAALLLGLGFANGAMADHGPRPGLARAGAARPEVVYAPVLDVAPIVRQITVTRPREECWLETAVVPNNPGFRGAAPVIAGGLLGGVIGHQFGHGRSNDRMTLLGALVGSAIASDAVVKRAAYAASTGYGREVTTQRCETVNETFSEDRIDGYRVTYEYMGRRYATVMPEPPRADRVRLHVTIEAAGY